MQYMDTALLVGCYIAIISHILWSIKTIEAVKQMIHQHENRSGQHVDEKDLVRSEVCALQVKRFEEKIAEVKQDVTDVKQQIETGFNEVKQLIRSKS